MPGKAGKENVVIPDAQSVFHNADGTSSMVLDDVYDPTYNPSREELVDYALWLGMEPDEDQSLMWIAKEGLKAPLPDNWRPCKTDSNEVYYFNFQTGDSMWDHPLDSKIKELYQRENDKKQAGQPFKKEMDDEVRMFLHGRVGGASKTTKSADDMGGSKMGDGPKRAKKGKRDALGKESKKNKDKDKESGLPSALSSALVKATSKLERAGTGKKGLDKDSVHDSNELFSQPTRAKGSKFGNLPTGGKLGGLSALGGGSNNSSSSALGGLGGSPVTEKVEPLDIKPGALGRQALPGLGGIDALGRGKPSGAATLDSVAGRNSATPLSTGLKSPGFDSQSNAESLAQLTQTKNDMEESLKRELERLREEHKRVTEDERNQHEQAQKRLRFACEQEIQDMETELNQKFNAARRQNAAKQSEWERELEEQNLDSRRRFEKELMEEFTSWKSSKEAALKTKRERLEQENEDAQRDFQGKKDRALQQLAREHEDELDRKREAWRTKKEAMEQRKKEIDERRRHVEAKKAELEERERRVQADKRALEEQQEAHEKAKRELSASAGDRTKSADALKAANEDEMAAVRRAQDEKIESLRNATAEELATVKRQQEQDLESLRGRHEEEEARARREWEEKHGDLQRAVDELEAELATRRSALEDLQRSIDDDKQEIEANTALSTARAQSAMSSVSEELEEELSAIRRRHADEKMKMERQLATEAQEIQGQKAALVAKLELELREEEEGLRARHEDAVKAARAEAERKHRERMEEMRQTIETEQSSEHDELVRELTQRKAAEEQRLEREMGEELERVMGEHREKIAAFKAEQEQRIQQEMNHLRAASEQEQAAQLERMTADQMELEKQETSHRIEERRAAQHRRLEDALRQLEAEAKDEEQREKRRIEQRVKERIADFEKRQALQLRAVNAKAEEKTAALVEAQKELEDEIREVRSSHERELETLLNTLEREHFAQRAGAETHHQEEMDRLQGEQSAQVADLRAAHMQAMRDLDAREQEAVHNFNPTSPLLAERAQLAATHERELQIAKDAHKRTVLDAQETYTRTIDELKATHAAELVAAKERLAAKTKASISQTKIRYQSSSIGAAEEATPAPSEDAGGGLIDLHPLTLSKSCHSPSAHRHRDKYAKPAMDPLGIDAGKHSDRHRRHSSRYKHGGASREQEAVQQAKAFLKQKKRSLRKRMAELDMLRAKWNEDMQELKRTGGGDVSVLAKAKEALNQHAERLNTEAQELSHSEYWLQQRIIKMRKTEGWLDGDGSESMMSDCTSLTPVRPAHRKQRRERGDMLGGGARGGYEDPRVMMMLSSLSKQVLTLSEKVSNIEHGHKHRRREHHRHRSSRHKDPVADTLGAPPPWGFDDWDMHQFARQVW